MPFIKCRLLWHELSLPIIFLSLFPLKSVIINLDWLSSTESLLPFILLSSLSLAEFYHHGERISFHYWNLYSVSNYVVWLPCISHCNLTFHTLLPTWVMHWCFSLSLEEYQVHFHSIQGSSKTLAVALARLLAREGQTMDSMFDPSLCSPQERMSGFNTMTKLTYMITQ